ncbi:Gfo/Idh/MocA family protein [Prosthecomicrobium sp. N25]|uniref:Gfo/Idh/MocA family protein n=1 Tax=Prosthecomicrobium sp. N25 TaxID=3129254 RepID=UPI0030783D81
MTLRIGFIGGGGIASRHAATLAQFDDVEMVAVADPDRTRAEAFAADRALVSYDDHEEMLARERPDAVYVCTPPFAHGAPELALAARGIPFFVEKPIATDPDTAEAIGAAVERQRLVTGVGYHWRYLDTTEEAARHLRSRPPRLVTGYWLDATPPPAWWISESRSGGQMVEQTTHIFDLARVLVGEVSEVYAIAGRTPRPDYPACDIAEASTAALRFAGGAVGTISSTCLLHWPHRIGLHLFADGLAIELSEFELMVDVGQGRPVRPATGDPFLREDRDFVDAVLGRPNRIRAPYAEALKTHRLTMAAARSAREGRPIRLDAEARHG